MIRFFKFSNMVEASNIKKPKEDDIPGFNPD